MKHIFFICIMLCFTLKVWTEDFQNNLLYKPNILLQQPKKISQEEIDECVQYRKISFRWRIGYDLTIHLSYEQKQSALLVLFFGIPIWSCNYNFYQNFTRLFHEFMAKLVQGKLQQRYDYAQPCIIENNNPCLLNIYQLSEILHQKRCLFYTGAGLSAAVGIPMMFELEQSLKIYDSNLIRNIFLNPHEIVHEFNTFCHCALSKESTLAHYALRDIVQALNICIITDNIDILHEKTGILPTFIHAQAIYSLSKADLQEIDYLICIGMSCDNRGFIQYFKQCNPYGLIIAIDQKVPRYLSDNDFLVQGDVQVILPEIVVLMNHE